METTKKTNTMKKTTEKSQTSNHVGLVRNDAYLEPYESVIRGRHDHALWKIDQLTNHGKILLGNQMVMLAQGVVHQLQAHDAAFLVAHGSANKIAPDKDGSQELIRPRNRELQKESC